MRLSDIPDDCPLPRDTPFGIAGVSHTQLSVARHYGGCTFRGQSYVYQPVTDELIRADVLRWMANRERDRRRAEKAQGKAMQDSLL